MQASLDILGGSIYDNAIRMAAATLPAMAVPEWPRWVTCRLTDTLCIVNYPMQSE